MRISNLWSQSSTNTILNKRKSLKVNPGYLPFTWKNRKIKWFAPFRLESFRKYAPWYKLMQYFYSFLSVQMIWICVVAGRWISYLVKIYSFRDGTLEKVWAWGWEFSSRMKFPFYDFFFRPLHEYFLALAGVPVWIFFFKLNFPLRECIFLYFAPSHPSPPSPPIQVF